MGGLRRDSVQLDQAKATFEAQAQQAPDKEALMQVVRAFRHGPWHLCHCRALWSYDNGRASGTSSYCARLAVNVVAWLCRKHQIAPDSLIILAMGKAGAQELNYSSDIDVIFSMMPSVPIKMLITMWR